MSRLVEFFQDSTKQLSSYRLVFILGTLWVLTLATCQFFGLGNLPIAIYSILAVLVSAGYVVGKRADDNHPDDTQ